MNRGQGRALIAALSAASRNMDKGDTEAEDFVKTGVMEETEGTELINEAKRLMNQISNGD